MHSNSSVVENVNLKKKKNGSVYQDVIYLLRTTNVYRIVETTVWQHDHFESG